MRATMADKAPRIIDTKMMTAAFAFAITILVCDISDGIVSRLLGGRDTCERRSTKTKKKI